MTNYPIHKWARQLRVARWGTIAMLVALSSAVMAQPNTQLASDVGALKKVPFEELFNLEITTVSRQPERLVDAPSAVRRALVQLIGRHGRRLERTAGLEQHKLKILLVDDSRPTCNLLSGFLEQSGHAVRSAYDAKSALLIAREFHPDVVLLDIRLPDMNGYQLMQRLKDLDGLGRAIFIALSGYGEDDAPGRGSVEFDHFLQKPLKIPHLEALLQSIYDSRMLSPRARENIAV